MLRALRTSYNIWNESATSSTAALRISTVLKMILEKVAPSQMRRWRRTGRRIPPTRPPGLFQRWVVRMLQYVAFTLKAHTSTGSRSRYLESDLGTHTEILYPYPHDAIFGSLPNQQLGPS
jgi:hypothetical protein